MSMGATVISHDTRFLRDITLIMLNLLLAFWILGVILDSLLSFNGWNLLFSLTLKVWIIFLIQINISIADLAWQLLTHQLILIMVLEDAFRWSLVRHTFTSLVNNVLDVVSGNQRCIKLVLVQVIVELSVVEVRIWLWVLLLLTRIWTCNIVLIWASHHRVCGWSSFKGAVGTLFIFVGNSRHLSEFWNSRLLELIWWSKVVQVLLMLLLSQGWSRLSWLLLLLLLLILNGLILSLTHWYLLLNSTHYSLSILLSSNRITFHSSIVESSILRLSLVLVSSVRSDGTLSVSHGGHILSYLRSLSRFVARFLQLRLWDHLTSIEELLICSKLWVLWNRWFLLENLSYLAWCQDVSCFVRLVMHAVVHVRYQALVLLGGLQLAICFVLSTNTAFGIVPSKLSVDGNIKLLITSCSWIVVYWGVSRCSIFVIWILIFAHVLNELTVIHNWNHHITAVVEILVSAHSWVATDTSNTLSVMMINVLSSRIRN